MNEKLTRIKKKVKSNLTRNILGSEIAAGLYMILRFMIYQTKEVTVILEASKGDNFLALTIVFLIVWAIVLIFWIFLDMGIELICIMNEYIKIAINHSNEQFPVIQVYSPGSYHESQAILLNDAGRRQLLKALIISRRKKVAIETNINDGEGGMLLIQTLPLEEIDNYKDPYLHEWNTGEGKKIPTEADGDEAVIKLMKGEKTEGWELIRYWSVGDKNDNY